MDKHGIFSQWNFKIGKTQMPVVVVKKFLQNGSVQYNLWCPYFSDSGQASKSCDIFSEFFNQSRTHSSHYGHFYQTLSYFFFSPKMVINMIDPNFKSLLLISKMDLFFLKNDQSFNTVLILRFFLLIYFYQDS